MSSSQFDLFDKSHFNLSLFIIPDSVTSSFKYLLFDNVIDEWKFYTLLHCLTNYNE